MEHKSPDQQHHVNLEKGNILADVIIPEGATCNASPPIDRMFDKFWFDG